VHNHPDLVKKYMGSVVPYSDNFYATLNSAVFTDGSFAYIPKGREVPDGIEHLLPHQRQKNTGQFERTLIIADEGRRRRGATWKGCTAPAARRESTSRRRSGVDRAR